MGNRLVCICNMVSENEIVSALKKGAKTTEDVQYTTRAGTSCGKCLVIIDRIVEDFHLQGPEDPQQSFSFE